MIAAQQNLQYGRLFKVRCDCRQLLAIGDCEDSAIQRTHPKGPTRHAAWLGSPATSTMEDRMMTKSKFSLDILLCRFHTPSAFGLVTILQSLKTHFCKQFGPSFRRSVRSSQYDGISLSFRLGVGKLALILFSRYQLKLYEERIKRIANL